MTHRTTWNLTLSHHTRITINEYYNRLDAQWCREMGVEPIFVEKSDRPSPNAPQDMWLYPCLNLIAYIGQGKMGQLHNGQIFRVISVTETHVKMFDIESFEIMTMEIEFVRHNLRLAYAFTNVGCQGRSLGNFEDMENEDMLRRNIKNGVTVWDVDSPHFRLEHLFTGTSRCRAGELLQVGSKQFLKDWIKTLEEAPW